MWSGFIVVLSLGMAAVPPGLDRFEVLSEEPWIGCVSVAGAPWCRVVAELPVPMATVDTLLHDFRNYAGKLFPMVRSAVEVEPSVVHLVIDMPAPLSDRDYVTRFVRREEGKEIVYDFSPVVSDRAPPSPGVVRLPEVAGEWRLATTSTGTRVSYTWQGELGGDVPAWALPQAHRMQGQQVVAGLRGALGVAPSGG